MAESLDLSLVLCKKYKIFKSFKRCAQRRSIAANYQQTTFTSQYFKSCWVEEPFVQASSTSLWKASWIINRREDVSFQLAILIEMNKHLYYESMQEKGLRKAALKSANEKSGKNNRSRFMSRNLTIQFTKTRSRAAMVEDIRWWRRKWIALLAVALLLGSSFRKRPENESMTTRRIVKPLIVLLSKKHGRTSCSHCTLKNTIASAIIFFGEEVCHSKVSLRPYWTHFNGKAL